MDVTLSIFIKGLANFIHGFLKFILLAMFVGMIVGIILGSVQAGMILVLEFLK